VAEERLEQLLDAYLDNALDDVGHAQLEDLLRASPENRKRFWEETHLHAALRSVARESQAIIAAQINQAAPARRLVTPKTSTRGSWKWLAMAACLVIAAGVWFFQAQHSVKTRSVLATVIASDREAVLVRQGETLALQPGVEVLEQDRIRASESGTTVLQYYGETTTLTLSSGAAAWFWTENGAKRVRLDKGVLLGDVAPQPTSHPMVFLTPHAEALVLGTQLTLRVDKNSTRLDVAKGSVRLTQSCDGKAQVVAAGEFSTATAIASVPPLRVVPVAEKWEELFNGKDLTGWTAERGNWRFEDGVVTGDKGPKERGSKITSNASYGEFELTCQMQVNDVTWGEIQLRDNAWQFAITGRLPGVWREVRVVARGATVTCSIDGQAVRPEVDGTNSGVLSGPLGFLVALEGQMKIKEVRLRVLNKAPDKAEF
jgi:ferric-dicitrate binding protein FerR (iron transport regulator)